MFYYQQSGTSKKCSVEIGRFVKRFLYFGHRNRAIDFRFHRRKNCCLLLTLSKVIAEEYTETESQKYTLPFKSRKTELFPELFRCCVLLGCVKNNYKFTNNFFILLSSNLLTRTVACDDKLLVHPLTCTNLNFQNLVNAWLYFILKKCHFCTAQLFYLLFPVQCWACKVAI